MSRVSLRKMRAVDMVRFSRFILPRFYGVVVVRDGRDIGAGAIVWGYKGRPYLSLEITEELRAFPIFMTKVAKSLIKAALVAVGEIYTIEDRGEATSARWLERLGFKLTEERINGDRLWHQSSWHSHPSSPVSAEPRPLEPPQPELPPA